MIATGDRDQHLAMPFAKAVHASALLSRQAAGTIQLADQKFSECPGESAFVFDLETQLAARSVIELTGDDEVIERVTKSRALGQDFNNKQAGRAAAGASTNVAARQDAATCAST